MTLAPLLLATSLVLVTWVDRRFGGEIWVNDVKVCESNPLKVVCPVYAEGLDAWEGRVRLVPDPGGWEVIDYYGYAYARGDTTRQSADTWLVSIPAGQPGEDRFIEMFAIFREVSSPECCPVFSDRFETGDLTHWSVK